MTQERFDDLKEEKKQDEFSNYGVIVLQLLQVNN